MSLPHALLGLINYQPTTGYELKATFNRSIHFFWNATLPQIYRTLNQMEKKGWLTADGGAPEWQTESQSLPYHEIWTGGIQTLAGRTNGSARTSQRYADQDFLRQSYETVSVCRSPAGMAGISRESIAKV